MFVEVMKESVSRWWDRLGYSLLNSFLGALNPVFLALMVYFFFLVTPSWNNFESSEQMLRLIFQWMPVVIPAAFVSPLFPTTLAAFNMQKRVLEHQTIYFKDYFKDYGKSLLKTLLPSFVLILIYGALSFTVTFAGVFYFNLATSEPSEISFTETTTSLAQEISTNEVITGAERMNDPILLNPAQIVILALTAFILLIFFLSQFVVIAVLLYNYPKMSFIKKGEHYPEGFKLTECFRTSFKIILAEGLTVFLIFLLHFLLWILLTVTRILSIFVFIGFSGTLRVILHKKIVLKYNPPEDNRTPDEREAEFMDQINSTEAWKRMMSRIDDQKKDG